MEQDASSSIQEVKTSLKMPTLLMDVCNLVLSKKTAHGLQKEPVSWEKAVSISIMFVISFLKQDSLDSLFLEESVLHHNVSYSIASDPVYWLDLIIPPLSL